MNSISLDHQDLNGEIIGNTKFNASIDAYDLG